MKGLRSCEIFRSRFVTVAKLNLERVVFRVFCVASLKGHDSVVYIRKPFLSEASF